MFRRFLPFFLLLILILVTAIPATASNGVDVLRGRWDVTLQACEDCHFDELQLFIDDIQPAEEPDSYLANGCMKTLATDQFAPLSLEAADLGQGQYSLTFLSTVIPWAEEPFVIRFDGQAQFHIQGVSDDHASGSWQAEFWGERWQDHWQARHHDRRQPHCPPFSAAIEWERDVFAHQQLSGEDVLNEGMDLEGRAPIVSSGMLVTAPDGKVYDIPAFDDIFSPEVDFISHFRYQQEFPGLPIAGEPYHFVLLDIFGNPIPGTERTDTWYGCVQDAPYALEPDLAAAPPDVDFHFTYDGFLDAAAGFNPSAGAGTYKIAIYGDEFNYGTHFQSTWHRVPFASFGEFLEFGTPDGNDFGQGLEEMPPGLHQVVLESVSDPPAGSSGLRNECFIHDIGEILYMERDGESFSFSAPATITGQVTEQGRGNPLGGIFVSACDHTFLDEPMCWGMETNENGVYWISTPAGSYRVETHSEQGWIKEFWEETPVWEEADPVHVTGGEVRNGINFTLEPGGSISGAVRDQNGNPLGGIAVDIEEGGYGQCTAEDGSYTMAGLPLGTYTVVAGRDFCEAHTYVEARVEGVALTGGAPDTSGVNFALELGGIISGVVKDSSNQPLANIGVDIEEGGYGQCTDENGQFSMRLAMGTYVIAAGRDFCGVAAYAEALTDPPVTISEAEPQAYVEIFLALAD